MAEKTVLVIGGGISGITVASELAQVGIPTTLIEKEASLGGLAGSFCCKASESCNKCFACVVDKRCSEIPNRQGVTLLTQTTVTHLEGAPGAHRVSLKKGKEKLILDASAIVVATGIDPYDASQKPEYGYGLYRNVITARDLDEMLRFRGTVSRPSTGQPPTSIAFFQCVGSRDESIGNLYCSQVCCAYALRLIKAIRHAHPAITATFLYMDIQPAGPSFQQFLDSCRQDKGIRLIRSLPSKVYHSPVSEDVRVRLIDPEKDEVVEETFDLIVLSVGMVLRKDSRELAQSLGLTFTEDGFLASPPPHTGLFVAGACHGPKDIDRSILHAKSTALRVLDYLRGRF